MTLRGFFLPREKNPPKTPKKPTSQRVKREGHQYQRSDLLAFVYIIVFKQSFSFNCVDLWESQNLPKAEICCCKWQICYRKNLKTTDKYALKILGQTH